MATLSVVTDSSPETGASWTEEEALNVPLCPSEGSNSHCDARTLSQSDRGVDKTDFRFPFSPFRLSYMQLAVPNVVAIAVRMVITMLRILPQVLLLLNVPIVVKIG